MNKKVEAIIKQEASKSRCRYKHGAVLVCKGSVISQGRNRIKWPLLSLHAEIDALLGVPRKLLDKSVLYVGRLVTSGKLVNSKPCPRCRSLLRRIVKGVRYTDSYGNWQKLF